MRRHAPISLDQDRAAAIQAGLTLAELLALLLVAGMLLLGLYAVTAGQRRTYSGGLATAAPLQNAATAMEYLQRQIRLAGHGLGECSATTRRWAGRGEATAAAPLLAFQAFKDCSLAAYHGPFPPSPGACTGHRVDSIAVRYSTATMTTTLASVRLSDDLPSSSEPIRVPACQGVRPGHLLALWDPGADRPCTLLEATAISSPCAEARQGELRCASPGECLIDHEPRAPFNPPTTINILPPGGYPRGSLVLNLGRSLEPVQFSIQRGGPEPRLVRWRKRDRSDLEVIAESIDDLQVSWACDENQDGRIDEGATESARRSDEWAFNVAGDAPPSCRAPGACAPSASCQRTLPVRMVRLTITALDYLALPAASGSAHEGKRGQLRRTTLHSTIVLRNTR